MAENIAAINLASGLKADRKLEMIFVNMGTSETAEWEILGRGVEEASVAFNHDTNQATDILGITDTVVRGKTRIRPRSVHDSRRAEAQ